MEINGGSILEKVTPMPHAFNSGTALIIEYYMKNKGK